PIRCEQPPQSNKICCSAGCKAADNILRQQLRNPRFAMSSSSDDSNSSSEDEEIIITDFPNSALQGLTQPDPRHRTSVGDSPADLQTLAHDAIRVHTEKCILYLFELGANSKAADANGDTAAHLAARRDHLRLLTLLSFDAKWLRNDNGATPLMEAARTGSWKCAKHLLHLLRQAMFNECRQHGNSKRSRLLGLKNREGRTASDLARLSGHSELASYIERYDGKIYFDKPLALARNVFTDHALDNEPSDDEPDRLKGNFYPVTDPQGYCLIINISKYDTGSHITFKHTERQGSVLDVERVQKVFQSLRFIVEIREDLTAEQ
uniref:CASPASE_P20 domain-containing protein n=1 Tax=Macrostomum lignano TaxID=282301 RepID=A0A1I8J1V4_9PLAT